jgi:hypothetical protein
MEAAAGFEPAHNGFAVRSLNHLGTPPCLERTHSYTTRSAPASAFRASCADKHLVSQFHLLGNAISDESCTPPVLMAFDCLHVHGLDVRGLPLHRRREMLEHEIVCATMVYPVRRLPDNGLAAWTVVKERGYEGLVAKDPESTYRGEPTRGGSR